MDIDFDLLTNNPDFNSENIEDFEEQKTLLEEATAFVKKQLWCQEISEFWWAEGWADLLAIFLFKVKKQNSQYSYYWVITGDIPPAYIQGNQAVNGFQALGQYIKIMSKWVEAIYHKKTTEALFPINVPKTKEYADMLNTRLKLINDEILTHYSDYL